MRPNPEYRPVRYGDLGRYPEPHVVGTAGSDRDRPFSHRWASAPGGTGSRHAQPARGPRPEIHDQTAASVFGGFGPNPPAGVVGFGASNHGSLL